MLRLRYTRASDAHQYVDVFGDPDGIRDLYWQITRNYNATDGTEIGNVRVYNTLGIDITADILTNPHGANHRTSSLER